MNSPKKWDGKITFINKNKKWSVHKMIEYPANGLCVGASIASGFNTRKEAKEWTEQYDDLKPI